MINNTNAPNEDSQIIHDVSVRRTEERHSYIEDHAIDIGDERYWVTAGSTWIETTHSHWGYHKEKMIIDIKLSGIIKESGESITQKDIDDIYGYLMDYEDMVS